MLIFIFFIITSLPALFLYSLLRRIHKDVPKADAIIGVLYFISILVFIVGMEVHDNEFSVAIDSVDMNCYTPISFQHSLTFCYYFISFNLATAVIWVKENRLPPLTLAALLSAIIAGIIHQVALLLQITQHNRQSIQQYDNDGTVFFIWMPVIAIFIGIVILIRTFRIHSIQYAHFRYSNKVLQLLHNFTIQAGKLPVMAFILIIPYVAISTLVLIIFGQEPDSAIKVFTDTSLWRLSQQMHPPILNHNGHYLCTVAAKGNPKLVKPLAVGTRAGQKIIVNRQLQIANAFEELVGDISPACHKMIRKNYDRYGYNLSKKINTSIRSDITYILMKPLEWVFLITLYMFCNKPESKITKQYLK